MGKSRDIKDAFNNLVTGNIQVYDMKVVSVDTDTRTALCTNGEIELTCRIMASVDDGILFNLPAGSSVVVLTSTTIEPLIIQYSEIRKVTIITDNQGVQIESGAITLNDGSYDGLVKVQDLTAKLNNLENDLNTIKAAFAAWVVVPNDGGAALKLITAAWSGQNLSPTQQADIENPNITHGPSI